MKWIVLFVLLSVFRPVTGQELPEDSIFLALLEENRALLERVAELESKLAKVQAQKIAPAETLYVTEATSRTLYLSKISDLTREVDSLHQLIHFGAFRGSLLLYIDDKLAMIDLLDWRLRRTSNNRMVFMRSRKTLPLRRRWELLLVDKKITFYE